MLPEPIAVALKVIDAMEAIGIEYLIGGSLASALHGVPRATLDADVVADIHPGDIERLFAALRDEFYVDVDAMREAVRRRGSFNVIHLETMFKVDIFVLGQRPFDLSEFSRRVARVISMDAERSAFFATAEDTVLAKIEWYAKGGRASQRQLSDVLGVLRAQGEVLDYGYLTSWAARLGFADLLRGVLDEAGHGNRDETRPA